MKINLQIERSLSILKDLAIDLVTLFDRKKNITIFLILVKGNVKAFFEH